MTAAATDTMMSASETNKSGTVAVLEERYALGELLGEGAMGQVFAARDMLLGIDVAVKTMHPALAKSRRQVARFTAEATITARMLSPHVVKVLGIAVTRAGAPCIVYERLQGETLGQRIAREGSLSLADTVEIVKQTARGLARAHQIGIVHRDVKPDNIFLTRDADGRMLVKVLDFGIAISVAKGSLYSQYELAGTPEYMAPELLFGTHDVDHRADVYALGVVFYECIIGRCPFQGDVAQIVDQLRSGARATFAELRPDLSGAVDAWLDNALHPDPYWRFDSAKTLGNALDAATRPAATARTSLRQAA